MPRHYIEGPVGQLHLHEWGSENADQPAILCLAPAPFSGVAWHTLAPLLAAKRRVIAVDYPGYGNSDEGSAEPSIELFAQCAAQCAEYAAPTGKVDLLGFHTGTLVACETAISHADRVNRLLLVDIPFFGAARRAELLPVMGATAELSTDLAMLEKAWEFCVTRRVDHTPLARCFDMFIDQARTGTATNNAFRAAFSYACEERFGAVSQPTTVIATKAGLYDETVAAADALPSAELIDLSEEVTVAVLEAGAPVIARTLLTA